MKLLLELRDKDIGAISKKSIMKERAASRAILMNNGKIALMNVTKHSYHKLPGGGVEKGESIEEALLREMKEETGCKIKIIAELGKIIEHRTHLGIIQTSYCYLAEVVKKGKPEFDKGELSAGYKLEWVKIDEAIKKFNLQKSVVFPGWIDEKDKPALYKLARCFVFPSLYEGFGIPIIEAMAAGTPVVSSNKSCLPEVGGDGAIFADPENPGEFAKKIREVLSDENLANRLIEKGREVSLPVEIGQANDTQIEIKSGLAEGQTIITGQNGSTSGNPQSSGSSPFSSGFRGAGGGVLFRR